ncbi:MAG: LPS export ABC transporter ATP-binding protein [Spirochaetales bacterium]|jgi:lipopolysaccharide export system ATP-binding protein|nr:LPS export ABC transporter ATP-binding protein [Spirochaetales bacterium]
MAKATLQVENLKKRYGRKTVVKDISLQMESSQIIGLLGPNGAGKTTMFYMIVGFIKSDGGRILLNGRNVTSLPMYSRSRLGLSYLPQEPSIFRKLTVEDNLKLVMETRNDLTRSEKRENIESLIEEFGLQGVRKQFGYTLSGGERRRTEIARALASNPLFLLLDEPFAGIDPKAVFEIKRLIKTLAERGIGILITDHNVRDTLEITHESLIINEGEVLASGKRSDLLRNEEARRIYFGDDFSREGELT